MIREIPKTIQEGGDVCGASVMCLSVFGWIPKLTAILALVWFLLRVWESDTVRELTNRTEDDKRRDRRSTD